MASRKKPGETLTVSDVFPENPANPPTQLRTVQLPEFPPDPVEYDDVTALNNTLDELGAEDSSSAFVTVYREMQGGIGKAGDEYLGKYPVGEFTLEALKAQWGAGKYKVSVYRGGGLGLAARKVITIAKDPTAAVPAIHHAPAQTDLTPVLAAIKDSNDKMISAIMALAQGQQKQPSRMEMLQEMQIMAEITGGNKAPAAPTYDPVSLLKLGVEMAANGGGESNASWVNKIIDQFGPVFAPALADAVTKQPAAMPHAPRLPNPVALPPTPAAATPTPQTENPMNIIVGQYLNMLKRAAEVNAPVEEYADSILSMVPSSQVADLENMIRGDDWMVKIRAVTNAADIHPVWFTNLRNTLIQFIDEDKLASTHLTGENGSGSVGDHANDNTGIEQPETGIPGGTA